MTNRAGVVEGLDNLIGRAFAALALPAGPARITPLFGDGSDRRFFRVRSTGGSFVALVSPRVKPDGADENDSYFLIGTHLRRRNVPVPSIFWADLARGCFVLEDLGDFHLQTHVNRRRVDLLGAYQRVMRLLVDMQQRARESFETSFCFDTVAYDSAFAYERELEYFRERFLNGCLELEIGPDDLRHDFENIAEAVGAATFSHVIHRDFQSRNIMISECRLRLVDFQGMRFGPPAYDLASLLIDPYVGISPEMEWKALALYWSIARGYLDSSFGRFLKAYGVLRLCRNLQVLGAYSYLGLNKGKRHFLRYLPRALKQLSFWLNHHHGAGYPDLQRLVNRIERTRRLSIRMDAFGEVFRDNADVR